MYATARRLVPVVVLVLIAAAPAPAALTKAQQACVNTENASWQKLAAAFGKVTGACIKRHNKGASGDIPTCVVTTGMTTISKGATKLADGYDAKCVGLDGGAQPKLPGVNPASGPGAGPEIDPNYVNTGPVGPLLDVRAAGAAIYGYVSTSFATVPLGAAKADIDLYYTPSFWRGAGVQVDGIFLDEMSSDLPDVGYYQQLRDYVHAKDANALVIANPGQPATQDTSGGVSGFTVMDYATAADILVTFEGTGSDYRLAYGDPAWVDALPASHFAHLVHGEASATDMQVDVDLARRRKAGMLYVTDDVLVPNPWDKLATYWLGELDLLSVP